VVRPTSAPARVILFLGGEANPAADRAVVEPLAGDGALVLAVSAPRWIRGARGGRCAYPAGELESLAQDLEKRLGLAAYLRPILVGTGRGGTVAWAAASQAPAGTFLGALAIGDRSALDATLRFCAGGAADRTGGASNGAVRAGDPGALRDAVRALDPSGRPALAPTSGPAVADLPLVEVPSTVPGGKAFALLVTGDGGWAGIDRQLAAALSAKGLPVVGVDSLKYFWTRRTPEGFAADLGRVVEHYAAAWGRAEVALVGYSRGADVLPAAAALLAATPRARVRALALIGPGREAEFELHLTDFLTSGSGGRPILPDVERLGATPIVCLYGRDETDESLCPLLRARAATRVVDLGGGHHFGGDYGAVAREVLLAIDGATPGR
jgi:type IV secretory pathway VirJ component